MNGNRGKLLIVGFGPGSEEHITGRALSAIRESDSIIGYNTYVDLIRHLLDRQEIVETGMTEEVSRAREAVRQAEAGKTVAVISSGDAGVYGMAGLIYEVLAEQGWKPSEGVEVEVIPGISSIQSCASRLGAPIMHDACTISLSDHLTPWELIEKRLEAAAAADFVVALYNPRSGRRTRQIMEAQRILLQHRSPDTPVGIVKSCYRDSEHIVVTTLEKMLEHDIGMLTTVIIGNSSTREYEGLMITPRGYQRKYTLTSDEQQLRPHERLRREAEPWALQGENPRPSEPPDPAKQSSDGNRPDILRAKAEERQPLELAHAALALVNRARGVIAKDGSALLSGAPTERANRWLPIFEAAVAPGVAAKTLSAAQLTALAEIAGADGTVEYTPHHQLIVRIPTDDPGAVTERLRTEGMNVYSVGDVVSVKACDFCNMEKIDSLPYAVELEKRLAGLAAPKELRIGFNGCGMACYNAVNEDIGIVYRKGRFDLFLGGKTVGRNAHAAQPVAEGIEPEALVATVAGIVEFFRERGHPNERFHKFFKRIGELGGYAYKEAPAWPVEALACGD